MTSLKYLNSRCLAVGDARYEGLGMPCRRHGPGSGMFKYQGTRGLQHPRYEHLTVVLSVYERLTLARCWKVGLQLNQSSKSILAVNAVSFYLSAV